MATKTNRVNVDGTNVRFWVDQEEAERNAVFMRRHFKLPYEVKLAPNLGWYIKSTREYHDADGKLPRDYDLEARIQAMGN